MFDLQRMSYRETRVGEKRWVRETAAMVQVRCDDGMDWSVDEDAKKWLGFEKYMLHLLRIGCKS